MKKTAYSMLSVLLMTSAPAWALPGKIVKGDFGMCVERNEFFGYIDANQTSQPIAEFNGWIDEIGVGSIRVNVPHFYGSSYDSNATWWNTCWTNAAAYSLSKTPALPITFLFGNARWPESIDKTAYLNALKTRIATVKGKIAFYELGNEVDLDFRDGLATVAQYKEWLIDVAGAIRTADPDAKIILASTAGAYLNGVRFAWMREMLAAGCGNYVDYYSIHTYYHTAPANPADNSLKDLTGMVNTWVTETGAPRKPLFVTEGGHALTGPYVQPGSDSGYQQRWNTQRVFRLYNKDLSYPVQRLDTYLLKDNSNTNPYDFGLLSTTKTKRWQYYGMKNVYSLLQDSIFMRERPLDATSKCYEYMKANGQKIVVAWAYDWTTRNVNIPIGSATAQVLAHNGANNPSVTNHSNVTTVPISYSLEQKYIKTGNALYWKEGELPSSASFTVASGNHTHCYNGKHLNLFTSTTGTYDAYYTFSLASAGNYAVYVAASPASTWTSPYKYAFTTGTKSHPAAPYTGTWLASGTSSTVTGVNYGISNSIAWTYLGTFNMPAGAATFVMRVDQKSSGTQKYTNFLDAVYVERQ